MRRLARLDVSLDVAMHLFMAWMLLRWAVFLPFSMGFTFCGSPLVDYLVFLRQLFTVGGWALGLGVAGLARLEMRRELRPWFKRALRLSGQLLVVSILVCCCIFKLATVD